MSKMKKARLFVIIAVLLSLSAGFVSEAYTQNSGAIWTTRGDCGGLSVDVNIYASGEIVYINGSGFDLGAYDWSIVGQPGGASGDSGLTVASGIVNVDESGDFCFAAYTIALDDWGTYNVTVGNKGDNYRVNQTPTPTHTATFTPTSTTTHTPTFTPTSTATNTPTSTPTGTLTPSLTPTGTLVPSATPTLVLTSTATVPPPNLNTPVPTEAPTTGGGVNLTVLQIGAASLASISVGSYLLLKKKSE